ncbi:MAG: UDP-glucose/GDP-mannose dehydrogenase family protein [Deltaproteobacteria bacterium]|nr:UDP-glucose/GDP-mannose dehydrogenase family protein [Deltaproteobacteria bacterium]
MNICVVGVGYVGLVTGACFAEFGLKVSCVDQDADKIRRLEAGQLPLFEPGLEELVLKNQKEGRLAFTTDIRKAVEGALVVFIAVGTPAAEDGSPDLTYIREVARSIGETMNGYKVIATKSTVPVGTGKLIGRIIEEHQRERCPFDVVSNPEFLREGSAIEDFMRPDRVVIGASSEQAIAILRDLYSPLFLIETPFVITNVETAEMIKYASNTFLATKISFINEMANLCERVGADVHVVARGMGLDGRIGPKFLHPGPGYGGSCFPKDTQAILQIAKEHGYEFRIVQAVIEVNDRQRALMLEKIRKAAGGVAGKRLAVLGLTFKPNTSDLRESPALPIIRALLQEGAKVRACDPAGVEEARRTLPEVDYGADPYDTATGCDALIILTEWNQFRNLDWQEMRRALRQPLVIDLRNVYEPERMRQLGFTYVCVGRGEACPGR